MANNPAQFRVVGPYGTLSFPIIFQEFEDGYENEFSATLVNTVTNPMDYVWKKGHFSPITFSFLMFAGMSENISPSIPDAPTLKKTVEKLYTFALPPGTVSSTGIYSASNPGSVPTTQIFVGSAWTRKGYIQSIKSKWKSPYDPEGNAYFCEISLTFLVVFNSTPTPGNFSFGAP